MNKPDEFQSHNHKVTESEAILMKEQEKQSTTGTLSSNQEVKADASQVKGSPEEEETSKRATVRVTPTTKLPEFRSRRPRSALIRGALFTVIILLAAGGLVTWQLIKGTPDVGLYRVGSRQLVNEYAGGGGTTYPRQQLDISYPVPERVLVVHVKAGDQVVPNQPLLQLDPSQINAQISQAANDVAAAQAYLNSVSALYNPQAIAQARQAYQVAVNRYNSLVAQASSPTFHNGNIISPLRGIVTAVNISPDEVFAADTVLITIMNQSSVIVHAKIPLSHLGQVHVGLPAAVTPSALPDVNLQGTVISVVPVSDPQTDTFEADVQVTNPQQMLLPGMSAFVRIHGQVQAFALPRSSVLNPDQGATVFVVQDQYTFMRRVHVVGRSADKIFVDTGVSPGDTIVLVGIDKVQDGQQVNVTGIER